MNPVEKALRKVDATQQRYTPTAFVFGVVKKYGDDNGGVATCSGSDGPGCSFACSAAA